jgi:hypothetical protein
MSEYYLADQRAEQRARERKPDKPKAPAQAADIKITLLGDFQFPSSEPRGCDPYNSLHGKSPQEAWHSPRERR